MSETVKKGDFIELDYTGSLKEDKIVFDSTVESVAKKEDIFDPKMAYGPVAICVGQAQILKGLDDALEGVAVGEEKDLVLNAEQAFGKKDAKLLKLVPTNVFKKQGIQPVTGLQVNIDGTIGMIRSVSGGRTVVDFNHPFSGKEVVYKVKVIRKINDDKEKVKTLLHLTLNQKMDAINVVINEGKCLVTLKKEFQKEMLDFLAERVKKAMPEIKEVVFRLDMPKKEVKQETRGGTDGQLHQGSDPKDK